MCPTHDARQVGSAKVLFFNNNVEALCRSLHEALLCSCRQWLSNVLLEKAEHALKKYIWMAVYVFQNMYFSPIMLNTYANTVSGFYSHDSILKLTFAHVIISLYNILASN